MSSILFVDDDENVLEGLRDLLRPHRHAWEMAFEPTAERGLERLAEAPVDVVVSDAKMPGIDGLTFLRRVQEFYPDTVRVVLSGQTEQSTAFDSIGVAHRFLAKPCRQGELLDVLASALELRSLLQDGGVRRVTAGLKSVPSAPKVFDELLAALADPDAGLAAIARVLERDVAMCAKVLQLVNSAFFGLGRRVASVRQAAVYLGVETLRTLVVAGEAFRTFTPGSAAAAFADELENHALAVAHGAKDLVHPDLANEAFMAGMLHDIGKLVVASEQPADFERVQALSAESDFPYHVVEHDVYGGFTHADVGGYLLAAWGLPTPAVEAARYHYAPEDASDDYRDLVRAIAMAHERLAPPA